MPWKSNKYYIFRVCVCSLSYPARKAHTPALQYFSTLSHKRNAFRKTLLYLKHVFWFSLQLLSEIFLILKRTERKMIKAHIDLHVNCLLYLSDFDETWIFFDMVSKKSSNIKFHENPSSESRVVPCGWTGRSRDRDDEFKSRFWQFFESS
jgi:hypothetical protein